MGIEIFKECKLRFPYHGLKLTNIKLYSAKIYKILNLKSQRINIILTDNQQIKKINKQYRKKNKPTDVISFIYQDDFPQIKTKIPLGDIYISLEKALQNSKEFESCLEDEIKRLLTHGILHLIGYDHEISPKEEKRMQRKENNILSIL